MRHKSIQAEVDLFFREQYPKLVRALRLFLSNPHIAEEIAQEAMARAYRDWRKVRSFDSPEAWLYRVAFNLAKSSLRRWSVETRWASAQSSQKFDNDAQMDQVDLRHDMRKVLAQIPQRQRQALILRYYLEMTIAETSSIMDCPVGTVKTLSHRGLTALRVAWNKIEEVNPDVL